MVLAGLAVGLRAEISRSHGGGHRHDLVGWGRTEDCFGDGSESTDCNAGLQRGWIYIHTEKRGSAAALQDRQFAILTRVKSEYPPLLNTHVNWPQPWLHHAPRRKAAE